MSEFSEDSRVKFPALIHLVGMGFEYISSNNSAKPQDQQEPYESKQREYRQNQRTEKEKP